MMHGVMDRRGDYGYTYLRRVFEAMDHAEKRYNWLIVDWECYPESSRIRARLDGPYCWITGEELSDMASEEDFQWIWGVFCGFEKDIPAEEILKHPLPNAEEYNGYFRNPPALQHPLSVVELMPSDSSYMVLVSREKEMVDRYLAHCPGAEELSEFNRLA